MGLLQCLCAEQKAAKKSARVCGLYQSTSQIQGEMPRIATSKF